MSWRYSYLLSRRGLNRPRAVGIVTLPLLFQGCNRLLCRCFEKEPLLVSPARFGFSKRKGIENSQGIRKAAPLWLVHSSSQGILPGSLVKASYPVASIKDSVSAPRRRGGLPRPAPG